MNFADLIQLNIDIAEWEQKRDAASIERLDRYLSPELVFLRADGSVVGKDAYMAALRDPGPFTRRETHDVVVTPIVDRAFVKLVVFAEKLDGTAGSYRNVRVFSRRAEGWCLEVWVNDAVPEAPKS